MTPAMTLSPLYTAAEIRRIEHSAGTDGLMEKAGQAVATLAEELLGEDGEAILVVAGPGNNGGDALVAARHLRNKWHRITLLFAGSRDKLPPDAAAAYDAWIAAGGTVETTLPDRHYDLIIDGLFGIGLSKPLQEFHADLVEVINALQAPVLAIDIPSGLCADTGRILGCCVQATHTLTFLGLKPGLFTLEGPDHAGEVLACDLGVDAREHVQACGALLDTPPALPARRARNSHKGTFGSVGILGGDSTMVGAALLAGRAALLTGAGRVYAGLLDEHAPAVDPVQPELMLRNARTLLDVQHLSALVVGPGLGRSARAAADLRRSLHTPIPLLIDADALTLLSEDSESRELLRHRTFATMLTPHPGEAATLLGCANSEIQADRVSAALRIARDYHATTVLKGCGTVIATPDGRWFINTSGNPGMSVAGMGDILCGIITALIAQGLDAEEATLLGVHLHGRAADILAHEIGTVGLTASEVAHQARRLLNLWVNAWP